MNKNISLFLLLSLLAIPTIVLSAEIKEKKAKEVESGKMSVQAANEELFDGVYKDSIDRIKKSLENGADINNTQFRDTPLISAVRNGNYNIIKFLLEHGANINEQNKDGKTALMYAVAELERGGWDLPTHIILLLLQHDADKSIKDHTGQTALDYATDSHYFANKLFTQPIEQSIKWLKDREKQQSFNSLLKALDAYDFNQAKAIIAKDSDLINMRVPYNENTLLLDYAMKGNYQAVKLLLENGADATLKNSEGISIIDEANHKKELSNLLKHFEKIKAKD